MIIGSLSFSPNENTATVAERVRNATDNCGLIFHELIRQYFKGGYYLHPRLPYNPADLCYSDEARDIVVLLSGSVHNRQELYHLLQITIPVTDSELIASLFLYEGPEFVKRLNGDFAVFILQPKKKRHIYSVIR